ncbi:MAG: hypothetical protein P8L77_01870 [Gammaproteobacteria bacterium]|nr:hypothetical protein [Gammaproteobacteria bacterium]
MNQKLAIKPIEDCQAYVMVSMIGEEPSSTLKTLLAKPLVKGVVLNDSNIKEPKQFFKLVDALRKIAPKCLIMVDVSAITNMAIWMQKDEVMMANDKYLARTNVNGILNRQTGVYATVDVMVKMCHKHWLIPKFNLLKNGAGLFDESHKITQKINKMFYNTLVERGMMLHCEKDIKDQLVPNNKQFSIDSEQKEIDEVDIKLKPVSFKFNDIAHMDLLPHIRKLSSRLVHITIEDDNRQHDMQWYALELAEISNHIDLIDVPFFDESIWLKVLDYLLFNPRIEVDLKFKYITPDFETIVKHKTPFCCGFF